MAEVVLNLKELESIIGEFQRKLDRLKILYEQYFMGIEKREPLVPLKDVVRIMRTLDSQRIRNTGQKFRFRGLVQKFNTFKTYWNRTNRAIANGTYHRDLARVRRKLQRKGIHMPTVGKLRTVTDVERAMVDVRNEEEQQKKRDTAEVPAGATPLSEIRGTPASQLRQGVEPAPEPQLGQIDLGEEEQTDQTERRPPSQAPGDLPPSQPLPGPAAVNQIPGPGLAPEPLSPRPGPGLAPAPPVPRPRQVPGAADTSSRPAPPPPQASSGLSDQKMKSIYRRFIKAKQMCGEDTSKVKYDSLVQSISKQMPTIRKRYSGKDVDFQVVIRSGRAILKAMVKD